MATCHVTNDNREVPDNINCKSVNCGIPNNIDMPLIQVDLFNKHKSKIVTEPYFWPQKPWKGATEKIIKIVVVRLNLL